VPLTTYCMASMTYVSGIARAGYSRNHGSCSTGRNVPPG
jgi:hypothetical protein